MKRDLDAVIRETQGNPEVEKWSCEIWATTLLAKMGASSCEVSEDGENGAIVEK